MKKCKFEILQTSGNSRLRFFL